MLKFIFCLIIFAAGFGVGIYWGANHPNQANNVAQTEADDTGSIQAKIKQAKIDLLNELDNSGSTSNSDFHRMLDNEKHKLQGNNQ
jgi:hypothetical protein